MWWLVNRNHESYDCQDLNTHQVSNVTADRMKVYREDIQIPAPKVAPQCQRADKKHKAARRIQCQLENKNIY